MLNDAQTKSDTLASQVVGYAKQQREGYGYAKSFTGKELVDSGVTDASGAVPDHVIVEVIYVDNENYTASVSYPMRTSFVPRPSDYMSGVISGLFTDIDRDVTFVGEKVIAMLNTSYKSHRLP